MRNKKIRAKLASEDNLEHLRAEIREVTKSIFNLAKARQNLSEKVALIKESKGLAIQDMQVESRLMDSMETYATGIGLDPRLAREITKVMIESSKSAQRRAIYLVKIKEHLDSHSIKQVGIVGAGRMGGWFASYFKPLVRRVELFDADKEFGRRRARELGCNFSGSLRRIAASDLIIVAVPISKTLAETKLLLKQAESKQTSTRIIEISSIKEGVFGAIGKSPTLYSIHPLFGSSADQFADNSLILVDSGREKEDDFLRPLFPHFRILNLKAREHDKLMTLMLSLPHALALTFASIASEEKNQLPNAISSPSYDSLLQVAKKTLSENPKIYYEIQSMNRHNQEMFREIKNSVARLDALISGGDYSKFGKFFYATKKRLG